MSIRDLVPWGWSKKNVPVRRETHDDPFHLLQRRMNGLFDDFWSDFNLSPLSGSLMREGFSPKMEIKETDQNVAVTAELPGMTEKDIDVVLSDGVLTLKGEKKEEKKEERDGVTYSECAYGSFHRTLPLPCEVEEDKVTAEFKKGILTVTLPKTAKAKEKAKRIKVN